MKKVFDKLPSQTKLFWILKAVILVLCIGIILSAISVLLLTLVSFEIQFFVLSIYLLGFAVKIILCELHLKYALYLFPYMKLNIGKGVFFIFVGIVMISFGFGTYIITGIMGIIMLVCGVGFLILQCIPMNEKEQKAKTDKKLKRRDTKKTGEQSESADKEDKI